MNNLLRYSLIIAIVQMGVGVPAAVAANKDREVTVYSARKEQLIKPVFADFEKQTGIRVRYMTDKAPALLAKLKMEGERTPADMLLTVDAGNLWHAADSGLLEPLDDAGLNKNVPAHLRDPKGRWVGLSLRARTIGHTTDPKRLDPKQLSTYEDLADPRWKGRLCLRTSKKVYNQSLVAMLIAAHGEKKVDQIVRGWVGNLATKVFANDTAVLKAIAAGQCDVGIVNTYYFGRLKRKDPGLKLALFWPDQNKEGAGGVHVNVSGAGILRHAKHKQEARELLLWLSSPAAQKSFAAINLEYPVHSGVSADPAVAAWGDYQPSRMNLSRAGELQADAIRLMDRAGYK